jgi:type I restriction enzyme M protein
VRELTKADFSRKSAIFLRDHAQFDHLVNLPDSADRATAIIAAMESIEEDYTQLKGIPPKSEYQELSNEVLGQLLRTFNDPALKNATGDVFGRIYEYFLTQFADQGAHDNGEFFTPVSLVQLIVNVIEPDHGRLLDAAAGSGGMFVQSAHFIERMNANPTERVTFYGMEKNQTTIRLALMNLAVHGLEDNIQRAITYYEDPHNLVGQADFVMANPPFNVDEVDADKVKNDPRLPFGLPGVNKQGKVSNGNYLWISYFYSYLNERGRAGFVMSSQASSAGRDEAKVRQKLIESGAVDLMVAIRSNFFYTRTVPCELWFLDRAKPPARRDKVLMIDARHLYRQVTRKIYDFSPEQLAHLTAIVWLYRGQSERFVTLVAGYLDRMVQAAAAAPPLLDAVTGAAEQLDRLLQPFLAEQPHPLPASPSLGEEPTPRPARDGSLPDLEKAREGSPVSAWCDARHRWQAEAEAFAQTLAAAQTLWQATPRDNSGLHQAAAHLTPLAEQGRTLIHDADALVKTATALIDGCEAELDARNHLLWPARDLANARKKLDAARQSAATHLKDEVRYFHRQAGWLQERFPDADLCDVPGLCKLVDCHELQANGWSLTPGRYVGVAPEEEDGDFDFEEALREIHEDLAVLNAEAVDLAEQIENSFKDLIG